MKKHPAKKTEQVVVRMKRDLTEKIKEIAAEEQRTISAVIRLLVQEAMASRASR